LEIRTDAWSSSESPPPSEIEAKYSRVADCRNFQLRMGLIGLHG
jgi:hypothetical protein